jgi:LPS O-antigen subunit length determinant protein (WzzB/FepE family)
MSLTPSEVMERLSRYMAAKIVANVTCTTTQQIIVAVNLPHEIKMRFFEFDDAQESITQAVAFIDASLASEVAKRLKAAR